MKVEVLAQPKNILGEGPIWDYQNEQLIWVDIEGRCFFMAKIDKGTHTKVDFADRVGSIALTTKREVYLLALQPGIYQYNLLTQELHEIANPEKHIANNRFNDGQCDQKGRYWAGSMDVDSKLGMGGLYMVNGSGQTKQQLSDIGVSNGMAWSLDNKYFYYVDSAHQKVQRFDFDLESGNLSNGYDIIDVPKDHGIPDGMCIDSEGMLWIAHWDGANVSRWNPASGKLIDRIDVPALRPTSCCFGGENLDTLFITSARVGLSDEQLNEYPMSGAVFHVKVGSSGLRANRFII